MVFCDLSTPSTKSSIGMKETEEGSFEMDYSQFSNAYDDLKKKILEKGIPEDEIAFIHDANTEAQKKELFAKVPVRAEEDVDETALSYAEIKALATGNPLIIEKSNLEMEVAKLNLLKSSHMSQQFDLEDKILKYYPQEIKKLQERVAVYEKDLVTLQENTPQDKEKFSPMEIMGITYTEKADAGKAIIGACHLIQNEGPKEIGSYRGFKMELSYSILASEFRLDLKGALSHGIALGSDIHGNIIRIDNLLASLENKCETVKQNLDSVIKQRAVAKAELGKPFAMEEELEEKNKRLAELNALLNLDEKDAVLLDRDDYSEKESVNVKKKEETLEYMR